MSRLGSAPRSLVVPALVLIIAVVVAASACLERTDDDPDDSLTHAVDGTAERVAPRPDPTSAVAAGPPPTASPTPALPLTPVEFCTMALLEVVDADLPPALAANPAGGRVTLRYRLPPGAEPLLVWLGVRIEPGTATLAQIIEADSTLGALFPNASLDAVVPAVVTAHGFDLIDDGRTRIVDVPIALPSGEQFDRSAPWRWSSFAEPPFEILDPLVVARFRVAGQRVDFDGQSCTPRFIPLP